MTIWLGDYMVAYHELYAHATNLKQVLIMKSFL